MQWFEVANNSQYIQTQKHVCVCMRVCVRGNLANRSVTTAMCLLMPCIYICSCEVLFSQTSGPPTDEAWYADHLVTEETQAKVVHSLFFTFTLLILILTLDMLVTWLLWKHRQR